MIRFALGAGADEEEQDVRSSISNLERSLSPLERRDLALGLLRHGRRMPGM
jgi:hypothetical protein